MPERLRRQHSSHAGPRSQLVVSLMPEMKHVTSLSKPVGCQHRDRDRDSDRDRDRETTTEAETTNCFERGQYVDRLHACQAEN
jgi:hypothetical protein